ncbi:MAG: hypothetical protein PHH25_07935 [Bacteroidales bacterium]|jgi:hypothetical protein|nr:hypothetical protein [Bacteroidales bacterium]MDD3939766.1 hypothetical protein [Patescibacteria group bacterium]MDD4582280.1 hypothetical protein [Bacteroidales bacterium]
MKRFNITIIFLFLGTLSLFSQKNQVFNVSYYGLLTNSYYPNLKIKNVLENMGVKKFYPFTSSVSFGFDFNINHIDLSLDLGIGGMLNKQTKTTVMLSNLSIGYKLKKIDFLTLGGNISYHLITLNSVINKGSIDFTTYTLVKSTSFSLSTMQLMIGPILRFEQNGNVISLGYDFGIIPVFWQSSDMMIDNNYKERFDRIHLDYIYKIRHN